MMLKVQSVDSTQGVINATNPYAIPANQGELTFEIMTNDVSGVTGHGKIAFELLPGTGYRLGTTAIVQTTIIDNEAPQVNIPDNPLPESDNIPRNFNITSTNRPSGVEVNVTFEVDEKASTATFETDYRISNLTFGPSTRSGSFILSDRSNTHRLY